MSAISYTINIGGTSFSDSSSQYKLVAAGISERRRRRSEVTAPDIHGSAETSSALERGTYVLVVRCIGSSWSDCQSLVNALVTAADQRSFTLAVNLDGFSESWSARAGDSSAPIEAEKLWSHIRDVTLSIPVYPIPS